MRESGKMRRTYINSSTNEKELTSSKNPVIWFLFFINMQILFGAVAQLGERLHGMQEVRGSIPRSSTITTFRQVTGFILQLAFFLADFL
jgi:hypothetical protein